MRAPPACVPVHIWYWRRLEEPGGDLYSLQLELRTVVGHLVGDGNQTWVL